MTTTPAYERIRVAQSGPCLTLTLHYPERGGTPSVRR